MGRLTDSQLRAWLKQGAPRKPIADGDGLTFEITAAGAAKGRGTWSLRYRFAGKQKPIVIGKYPDISLAEARLRAARLRMQVHDGIDVSAERRRSKAALLVARSFRELAYDYLAHGVTENRPSTNKETRRYIEKDILPALGSMRVDEITGADVVALVKRISARSHSVAQRTFDIVRLIFQHGTANFSAKTNPCLGLRVKAMIGTRKTRERLKLTEDELRTLLAALPRLGLKNQLAIRILLACAVRKGELLKARWEHVDLQAGTWFVPIESSKTASSYTIPLPPTVVRWFAELKAIGCGSAWVVPGQRLTEHMAENTLNAAIARLGLGIRKFTPHDLRSTVRSYLTERLGVSIVVAERTLNHKLGGLLSVYDKSDYMDERRRALELWVAFLEECERPRDVNVTVLRAAA